MHMAKVIVHIDLNAFFVRAEEIKDPSLEGKAVAIGRSGRAGIVSTCSYKAREYGVRSAMPMNQAMKLCPGLIILPGDYRFYSALSYEFKSFIKTYTKIVEEASIDEVFADFTEVIKGQKDIEGFFKGLQNDLFNKTGLKCSIGIGPTKFLAKMGSDYKKPMGITIIRRKDIPTILYPIKIEDMFGVGKKTAPRLKSIGINTIGDLALRLNNEDEDTLKILGKFAYELKEWVNGYGDDNVITHFDDPKSIGNSTTLKEDTSNYETIESTFSMICQEVSYRAKRDNLMGTTIQIMVKDTSYQAHNKSLTFDTPTNDYRAIFDYAMKLYDKNYINQTIRALGVTLQNLVSPKDLAIQMTFFDYERHEEENMTKLIINEINRKLTSGGKLIRASEAENKKDDGNSGRD